MEKMKVFKFGGASTNSFDRIHNLAHILENHKDRKNSHRYFSDGENDQCFGKSSGCVL